MPSDLLSRLADAALVALRAPADEWPRGLRAGARVPDSWIALITSPDGRRRVAPAGEDPHPVADDVLLFVRRRPLSVRLELTGQSSADGNSVRATAEIRLAAGTRDDELAAFGGMLRGEAELRDAQLAQRCRAGGAEPALRAFVRENTAATLVHGEPRAAFESALRSALQRWLFESGLSFEGVTTLRVASDTLARREALERDATQRLERIQARELVEQAALAAARRRLTAVSDLFEKLRAAAADDDARRWHELLPALTPTERGRLLENLWRVTPDRETVALIAAVLGEVCVWVDPRQPARLARRVALAPHLGGLRSVRYLAPRDALAIGAARGVWLVAARTGEVLAELSAPTDDLPRTGFNGACLSGGRLIASHSQLGVWSWALDGAADPRCVLSPQSAAEARLERTVGSSRFSTPVSPAYSTELRSLSGRSTTIRCATALPQGGFAVAVDSSVQLFDETGARVRSLDTGGAVIDSLGVLDAHVYVGTDTGFLLRDTLDASQDVWEVLHRTYEPIDSLAVRRWSDVVEVVVPAGREGIVGVYPAEGMALRLMHVRSPVRRAWAADDALVALNDLRDRLLILTSDQPDETPREAPLARLVGSTVQDACLVTQPAEPT
ncbi:MAG: hypothetical protein AB7Q17_06280 [Phycisphaerae bacterium]